MNMQQLDQELQGYSGTEQYHKYYKCFLTDGVKAMADKAGAFWLLDIIMSYQVKHGDKPFQVWTLKVKDMVGLVTMQEDTGEPALVKQKIEYTDFPEGEFKLYCIDRVILLPSEY